MPRGAQSDLGDAPNTSVCPGRVFTVVRSPTLEFCPGPIQYTSSVIS